jgi:N-acetylmuramoyl-L-alanine amidase
MAQWNQLIDSLRSTTSVSPALKIALLAQCILESARGQSDLAQQHDNWAGLKFRQRMIDHAVPVDYRGTDGEMTTYCKFSSPQAFINGYWHFISSGPYDGYNQFEDDGAGYIRHIARCGYSADPDYVSKVLSLFHEASNLLGDDAALAAAQNDPRSALRLAVVVGHNRIAPGASAVAPLSTTEFKFNGRVAQAMKSEAWHYNIEAEVFLREPHPTYAAEIRDVYARVKAWGATSSAELHFNASDNTSASRSEVLYRRGSSDARALADACLHSTIEVLQLRNGGSIGVAPGDRGGGALHALDDVPAVLFEPFFGSNSQDCLRVATIGEQALAIAYLRGVRDWFVAKVS